VAPGGKGTVNPKPPEQPLYVNTPREGLQQSAAKFKRVREVAWMGFMLQVELLGAGGGEEGGGGGG
jgi:hypothetical protein